MQTLLRVFLLISLSLLTDVCCEEVFVRAGDMVVLQCPKSRRTMASTPSWASYTPQKKILTSDTNSTAPLLIHKRSLVLLKASPDHQGKYSCSVGNKTFWSQLVVLTAVSDGSHSGAQYTTTCFTGDSCTLRCPISNAPASDIPSMTRNGITWTKSERTLFKDVLFFSSVEETNQGTYDCTRSYLYKGQTYNMTYTNKLFVKAPEPPADVKIISPQHGAIFETVLGSGFVINCIATLSSDFDEVFWMTDTSSVDSDTNLRVFSNSTILSDNKEIQMTASLIFKEVLEEDLSKDFTCKLESVSVPSSFVTISLEQKKQETSDFPIVLCVSIVVILLGTAAAALTCIKLKKDLYHLLPPQRR
ncbi:interleukin-1 receptor type 1-like [Boleophthalmus pectinirostris]|uniref:interleukin-1 receptor type 1-like n=1 Tax=Boleophthalmus pectinirostris TaxID=150288 RepID=UPI00242ACE34|nr:interleukin-1 receptor type 1-like [Boleophthalmus pectinirostris]